jgi:hypothetical protein
MYLTYTKYSLWARKINRKILIFEITPLFKKLVKFLVELLGLIVRELPLEVPQPCSPVPSKQSQMTAGTQLPLAKGGPY